MEKALALARKGYPAPNPYVGAVLVKKGQIIGEGYHSQRGKAHAEVEALNHTTQDPGGSNLYVTLEPCSYEDDSKLTPSCTKLIIQKGIQKVIIASLDPNPRVAGQGVKSLREQGIEVEVGLMSKEESLLNRAYHYYRHRQTPWVHIKQAVTLEGYIATSPPARTALSGDQALRRIHKLRASHQAILVGGNTVILDNPCLDNRSGDGPSPLKIILEGHKDLPLTLKVFQEVRPHSLLLIAREPRAYHSPLEKLGIDILYHQSEDLSGLLNVLGKRGIISLLVEAGTKLASSLWRESLVNELTLIQSPFTLGQGTPFLKEDVPLDLRSSWMVNPPELWGQDCLMNWIHKDSLCLQA